MNKPVYLGLSILENTNVWILVLILKQKISMKILLMMLKKYLIHKIMKSIDHYLQEKIKK